MTISSRDQLPLLAKPIRSIRQLLDTDFAADPDPLNRSLKKWTGCGEPASKLQILACHDMRGGYNDDANPQGTIAKDGNAYAPWFWPLIDIFVYFAHARVVIPPLAWIQTCHRNDIPCLGTLIFEWDAGSRDIKQLLQNRDECIEQLVSAMIYYGFDGYLLNFECELGPNHTADQLVSFISGLTAAAHEALPWSKIIYYDSIDNEGHLSYQCALNESNSRFFHAADGIFIDYHWKPENVSSSVSFAGIESKRVFMGIDVFGRGTFGGGGYNIASAIRHCFQAGASVAIFAPGWAYESAGGFSKGRDACLRIEARMWTEAHYTVIQPDPNGWDAARLPDGGTLYQRSHEVNLVDRWDGDQINAHLLDSIPPISVFHREGSQLHINLLTETGEAIGSCPSSPTSKDRIATGFVGYGKGVRRILWKENSTLQHDEIPTVWIAQPPLADRHPILRPKPIRFALPFMSNFSQGSGKAVYKSGKRISNTPWYQMLQQDHPASFLFNPTLFPDCYHGFCVKWDRSLAFEGGNCVSCDMGPFMTANIPLVDFESTGSKSTLLKFSVTVTSAPDTSRQSLGVYFTDRRFVILTLECNFWKDWFSKFTWLSETEKETVLTFAQYAFSDPNAFEKKLHEAELGAVAHEFCIWRAGRLFPSEIVKNDSEWTTMKFELNASPVASIAWQLTTGELQSLFHLGQVIITESWQPPEHSGGQLTIERLMVDGSESLLLQWKEWNLESIAWCDIFLNNQWIGRSFTNAFVIDTASLKQQTSEEIVIAVQPTGTNGTSIPLHSSPCVHL